MSLGALLSFLTLWRCHSLGFNQNEEAGYISAFPSIVAASYSSPRPTILSTTCVNQGTVTLTPKTLSGTTLTAVEVQAQCTKTNICEIPLGTTLTMNSNLDVGALIIKGSFVWTDATQNSLEQFLCAGYVAVDGGKFNLSVVTKKAYIYIKDNNAFDPVLTKRGFGGYRGAIIDIKGKPLARTWSLLALPGKKQASQITLMHDATAMGWTVGDRIVIAPTTHGSSGTAESFFISNISGINVSLSALNGQAGVLGQDFDSQADWIEPAWTAQRQAEVIMMTRNVIITGDDFVHEPCQAGAPLTSANVTCVCENNVRTQCTRGLHTAMVGNGTYRLQYTRIEKCGQRGMIGKYCVHMHLLRRCPNCLIQGNSVEYSHQRGIVIHATSLATVDHNVMNDVRGANIYIEDGNEMYNRIRYNVLVCPWAQTTTPGQPERYACSVPGTDNGQADTSLNQAAIWGLSFSNYVIGNRGANSFNGMLYQGQGFENGRQTSQDNFCANTQMIGRLEGNTFHGHGRFGTYLLVSVFPKNSDRTLDTNGLIVNKNTCAAFDEKGDDRGLPQVVSYNVDYSNVFVGQYSLGDIQYRHHTSIFNNNLIYWKETKNFANGCSSHVKDSWWQGRNGNGVALPGGHGTVIFENVVFTGHINFESSHHCNIGTTGVLCMPTYLFVKPTWKDVTSDSYLRWGENRGAMYVLGPDDCANPNGVMFPKGYCSVANPFWSFLTALDSGRTCQNASAAATLLGESGAFINRWSSGILCKAPLRRLEIYTLGQKQASAPNLKLQLWQNGAMISSVTVPYFQIADDASNTGKQGYSMTIVPGLDKEYRLSLENGGAIPAEWAIEFSDLVFGNRWTRDQIKLVVQGRNCPAIVHSHHDRRFIWGDSNDFNNTHNWMRQLGRGACTNFPDMPVTPCAAADISVAESCPGKCPVCGVNQYCDCGTGTCMCESGYEGPTCQASPCTDAKCDRLNGRCSARFLGGSLPVAMGQCVCKPGTYGPRCRSDPCSCTSCGNGKCIKTGATTYYCQCDAGYEGPTCNSTCTDCAPPCIDGCRYYPDMDVGGPDVGALNTGAGFAGAVGCCGACKANPSCKVFVSPDYCYMKSSQAAPMTPKTGRFSGALCQSLPPVTCPEPTSSEPYVISTAFGLSSGCVWVLASTFVAMLF